MQDLLWYCINLDGSSEAEPLKRRRAFTFAEFQAFWREWKLTEDSYVWAQGKDDLKPLRTVPGLEEALMTLGAPGSVAAQGGAPRPAMDLTKESFFYKDKSGVRLGPSVLDPMKISWDFMKIDENTEVFAEGLMEGFQSVRKIPELHRALATGRAGGAVLGGGGGTPGVTTAFPYFGTSVKADGLDLGDGAATASEPQKVELAATRSLLEAAKTELRAKEATIGFLAGLQAIKSCLLRDQIRWRPPHGRPVGSAGHQVAVDPIPPAPDRGPY